MRLVKVTIRKLGMFSVAVFLNGRWMDTIHPTKLRTRIRQLLQQRGK